MRGDRDARDGEPTNEGGDPTGGEAAAPKGEPLDADDWAGTGTGTVTAGERRERSEGGLSAEGMSSWVTR